jgi:hypothetical protein
MLYFFVAKLCAKKTRSFFRTFLKKFFGLFIAEKNSMNSPAFDVLRAGLPPYLVPTIDKYLRAAIGMQHTPTPFHLEEPKFMQMQDMLMCYNASSYGLVIADPDGAVACLQVDEPDTKMLELVALSRTRYLVVGPTCVEFFDLQLNTTQFVVHPRDRAVTLKACRLSDSTFVLSDYDLKLYDCEMGQVCAVRRWPLRINQVVADQLLGLDDSHFLAVRGNKLEHHDIKSLPGVRSVSLSFRPQYVVSANGRVVACSPTGISVFHADLTLDFVACVGSPITSCAVLADACIVTGHDKALKVWKRGSLYHKYSLDFTPIWMSVSGGRLVAADGEQLHTFHD